MLEAGTPPAGVKVTPSFAKVAIPMDDEPELVVSEPSGDYDVVIDGDGDDDDGDELPTVPPPPPQPPAVVIASPGFEPVQLPPLPPSERPPAIEALPVAALVEPTPAVAKTPVAEPAVAKAPPIVETPPAEAPRPAPAVRPIEAPLPAASAPVARVVAPAPKPEPSTFGELLDRALALRPR
jgi:hypothetical protein